MSNWTIPKGARAETNGVDTSDSGGTAATADASADTKGSFVELAASTSFDYEGVLLSVGKAIPTNRMYLLDLAVGAAGSEVVFVPNVSIGQNRSSTFVTTVGVPVHVASGSRISCRVQCNVGGEAIDVSIVGWAGGFNADPGASRTIPIGVSTADSKGTVLDAGATINTKGSYAELSSSISDDISGFYICIGANENSALVLATCLIDLAIGASGSEEIILSDIRVGEDNNSDNFSPTISPFWRFNIPSGTRISARKQSTINDANDRKLDFSLIGIVQ